MGDWEFRRNPPWKPTEFPQWPESIPSPLTPAPLIKPWPVEQLKEYLALLKEIKAMEDKLGCPCVPNKADYIGLLKKRIKHLESKKRRA